MIGGFEVPFPGYPADQKDVCKLGATCPTTVGGSYTEKVTLPVASNDPSVSLFQLCPCLLCYNAYSQLALVARWKVDDSSSKQVGCIEVQLKIVS